MLSFLLKWGPNFFIVYVSEMTVWSGHVCHANGTILLASFEQLYRSGAQKFVEMCLAKRKLADGA